MKKIASGRRIARVIAMAAPSEIRNTPEAKLWLAVIENALTDAEIKKHSQEARRYLVSDGFERTLELLGINPDYVQEIIRDHAGWERP